MYRQRKVWLTTKVACLDFVHLNVYGVACTLLFEISEPFRHFGTDIKRIDFVSIKLFLMIQLVLIVRPNLGNKPFEDGIIKTDFGNDNRAVITVLAGNGFIREKAFTGR